MWITPYPLPLLGGGLNLVGLWCATSFCWGIDEVVVSAAIHPLLLEELMKLVEICSAISFFA